MILQAQATATDTLLRDAGSTLPRLANLDLLESEALHILHELHARLAPAGLMFSGGKDSACIAHLARKAFTDLSQATRIPFPFIHFDSGSNFSEVLEYRDQLAKALGVQLIVMGLPSATEQNPEQSSSGNIAGLIKLINQSVRDYDLKALIGGGRRDEELVRAKERIFSLRSESGAWNPHDQRPEPWNIYNLELSSKEHLRVFPISNWTERNVWEYIAREHIPLPSIYYAHKRAVVERNGTLMAVFPDSVLQAGEKVQERVVRCRTVGDRHTTGFILSEAQNAREVLTEVSNSRFSERAGRVEDKTEGTDMESRKKLGWP